MTVLPPELRCRILLLAYSGHCVDRLEDAARELVIGVHPETRVVREGDLVRLLRALEERTCEAGL